MTVRSSDDHAHAPELADIEIIDVPRVAGGLGAITSTVRHLVRDTGLARGAKALIALNQIEGFDCPGCAWPEAAEHRAKIEFCENGAKAVAEEAMTRRADASLFATYSIDELRAMSDFELGQLGRLTEPLVLSGRHYVPIAWDDAFELLASSLREAGPAGSAFYTSGRTSNEAAFLYQLVGRMFGTNNFPDCSNMCHESSGVGLSEVVGVGKGTVSLEDFEQAELILVIGQNPGTNHPRMLTTLRDAAKRGATIVSVNPLREVGLARFAHPQHPLDVVRGGVPLASETVQVQVGGDLAFVRGVAKAVLEAGAIDREFIDAHTTSFEDWAALVRASSWSDLAVGAGVSEVQMRRVAALYERSNATIACWAMGLTQHKHSVATIQEIVDLMLLRGNVGRPGAGLCPVRGHSNVQGDRTVGIDHHPKPAFLDALGRVFGFEPPRTAGLDVVDTIRAMRDGAVTAFVALGGNFLSATPDTGVVARALESCAMTASVSTKLNRTHLHPGKRALILPCLGRTEIDGGQFVTVEDSMSIVHRSQGVLPPASELLMSEPAIVARLGAALCGPVIDWDTYARDYDRIRDRIADVVPGFTDYNARVREGAGFRLPNAARERTFGTLGRARFTCSPLPDLSLPPGRLRMMTMRSHDQYNTTIYGLDDRYRGIRGERRVIFMSSTDMVERELVERQVVDLISEHDGVERIATRFIVVPFDLPRGNCASYFPEANPLVALDSTADKSNTPASKSIIVRVEPARPR
ncbi:MAG TPA: FdhF/YdeP family oxidoreductase [Kofleriaceae bacterium]|nr:FdhF/YdeP family oxidoreductase [Kofleriaceae bacterium]